MQTRIEFDEALIRRYDQSGPRYTSYPTAPQFAESFDEASYATIAQDTNASLRPLSLYVHLPFCATVCYYCACNKIITANRKRAAPYLADLHQEIRLQGALFDGQRQVNQLHWGGGTPTFISDEEMAELMTELRRNFRLADDAHGEYSIEIDPREVNPAKIGHLRQLGFNRISFGVQDFDPQVQRAVNRLQSEEQTRSALSAARAHGFRSINIDLIYGLPHQTVDSFAATVEKVLDMAPDRLSVFNYAHLPQMFKVQKQIDEHALPSPSTKLAILHYVIDRLTAAGYVYIGMDHFARPDDELAIAQQDGTLYRNFQGYSTHAGCDLIGLGITSIGMVGDSYSQNVKTPEEYHERLAAGRLPVYRGVRLTADDLLRRDIITQLICLFRLDKRSIASRHGIDFEAYFAPELAMLQQHANDGLLRMDSQGLEVLPRGRLLIRNICMVFDAYLQRASERRYSRVI